MFNYSDITLEILQKDLESTVKECKALVENIKSFENIVLSD